MGPPGGGAAQASRASTGTDAGVAALEAVDYEEETSLHIYHATPYLSHLVRRRLLNVNVITTSCQDTNAVVMLADISGYTRLTRWMHDNCKDREGAWSLSVVLNKLFGTMTTAVEGYGGDVVHFAGDAVIAVWPLASSDPEAAQAAALAAARAAAVMVADAAVSPAEGLVTALHVGITLSSVHEMTLGGIGGRFHHTVNGPACLDLERLVSAARPDHVCVNDAAWALLRAAGAAAVDVAAPGSAPVWELESIPAEAPPHERALWRSPRSTTDMLPPEKDSLAMRFISPVVQEALTSRNLEWLSENRYVACVFVVATGESTAGWDTMQAATQAVQEEMMRYSGVLHQIVTDDKGTTMVCVWGLPPQAAANLPLRAAEAAVQLREAMALAVAPAVEAIAAAAGLPVDPFSGVHAGLALGSAFCGNIGSRQRCSYAVVGDVMNMAARLAGAARAKRVGVLCDSVTGQLVRDAGASVEVQIESTLTLQLKNVEGPFTSHELQLAPSRLRAAMRTSMASHRGSTASRSLTSISEHSQLLDAEAGDEPTSARARKSVSILAAATLDDAGGMPRPPADFSTPLFGREEAVADTLQLLVTERSAPPSSGGTSAVLVCGYLSRGKSHFLQEVVNRASDQGVLCLPLLSCTDRVDSETPFRAWQQPWLTKLALKHSGSLSSRLRLLLSVLLTVIRDGLHTSDSASNSQAHSHSDLDSEAASAIKAGTACEPVQVRTPEDVKQLRDAERIRAVFEVVCAVMRLEAASQSKALLLVADDAHLMDVLSWQLLQSVVEAVRPLSLLVALLRSQHTRAEELRLLVPGLRTCKLQPLASGALRNVVAWDLGVPPEALPETLVTAVTNMSAGHPLIVREVMRQVQQQGLLRVDAETGSVELVGDLSRLHALVAGADVSGRLQMLLQCRLDALSHGAREVLRVASVLRSDFDLQLLRRCCHEVSSDEEMVRAAEEFVEQGIWVRAGPVTAPGTSVLSHLRYRFLFELVRSTLYQAMPADQRRHLHAHVVRYLEEPLAGMEVGARLEDRTMWTELAHHARAANMPVKATGYYLASSRSSASLRVGKWSPSDAARMAQEGLTSLRVAQRRSQFRRGSVTAPGSGRFMDADPVTPSAGADDGSRTPDSSRLGFARRSSLDNSRMLVSRNSGGGAGGSNPWADDSVVAEPPAGFDDDDSGTQHARRSSVTLLSAPSAPRRRSFDIGSASTLGGDGGGGADTRFSADELLDAAEQEMLDMQAEFERVLRSVERVQKSWAVIEKDRPRHGVALMAEFFRLAPDALPLFSFSDAAGRPGWVITEDKRVQRHAVTVISTVGAAVAGLRRFDQLMPTLHRVGKAHWPQHKDARLYFAPMGQALITVLREALGDAFTDDVEEAWRTMYDLIAMHMTQAIDEAEAQEREKQSLRKELLGDLLPEQFDF